MKRNLGLADRIIRMIIAAVLVSLNLSGIITGAYSNLAAVLIGLLLATPIISFCPIYRIFGWTTWQGRNRLEARK